MDNSGNDFVHTLPDGTIVERANARELFGVILQELDYFKTELHKLIGDVEHRAATLREYQAAAASRGEILIVRNRNLEPIDVIRTLKLRKASNKQDKILSKVKS